MTFFAVVPLLLIDDLSLRAGPASTVTLVGAAGLATVIPGIRRWRPVAFRLAGAAALAHAGITVSPG